MKKILNLQEIREKADAAFWKVVNEEMPDAYDASIDPGVLEKWELHEDIVIKHYWQYNAAGVYYLQDDKKIFDVAITDDDYSYLIEMGE